MTRTRTHCPRTCHPSRVTKPVSITTTVSNHIQASIDHETKTMRARSNGDRDRHPRCALSLLLHYSLTTPKQQAARRVTPRLFTGIAIAPPNGDNHRCQRQQETGHWQQHTHEERQCCEEVPTPLQHRSSLLDTTRRCMRTPPRSSCFQRNEKVSTSSFLLSSTQRGFRKRPTITRTRDNSLRRLTAAQM